MFIFNKSWITREVSIGWKKAHVLPLFKKGKWDDLSNYKPVRWAFNQYVFHTTKCKVIYLRIMNVADTCRIGDFIPRSGVQQENTEQVWGETLFLSVTGQLHAAKLLSGFGVHDLWSRLEIQREFRENSPEWLKISQSSHIKLGLFKPQRKGEGLPRSVSNDPCWDNTGRKCSCCSSKAESSDYERCTQCSLITDRINENCGKFPPLDFFAVMAICFIETSSLVLTAFGGLWTGRDLGWVLRVGRVLLLTLAEEARSGSGARRGVCAGRDFSRTSGAGAAPPQEWGTDVCNKM